MCVEHTEFPSGIVTLSGLVPTVAHWVAGAGWTGAWAIGIAQATLEACCLRACFQTGWSPH